ncbi:hypothetical protein V6N12_043365 [Hibiscus sabdariffa]|uniref:RNase H type-1 domain-containing protein n=1 Tax=Hibiscus sabdariffa TaxID=183260 RepID=A0ABR2DE88_9ROSI
MFLSITVIFVLGWFRMWLSLIYIMFWEFHGTCFLFLHYGNSGKIGMLWSLMEFCPYANTVQCSITWARYYSEYGAILPTTGIGSVSGVFRTDDGSWIYGFNKSIGIMQPLQAKLWGIFVGLQIAWDIGFERLLIQSDSKEAIKLLNDNDATSNHCALVRSIARLRNLRWETTTQWIPCTGNEPADMLAKFDNLPCYTTTYFDQPPKLFLPLLDLDTLNSM